MPLGIETSKWQNKPVEERICKVCESGEVENEFLFIFSCTLYNNIRATFLQNIMELNEVSQIKTFMSKNFACLFAKLICDMFQKGMIVCLFKSSNLTTNSPADKPDWAGS